MDTAINVLVQIWLGKIQFNVLPLGLIQDFFVKGGNSRAQHHTRTRGVNFWNLRPLRLFLVASETIYTNKILLYIILLHSIIICFSIILGKYQRGGDPRVPPPCINPCLLWPK